MATELEVVNEALVKLGASPIASLSDAGAEAVVASALFRTTADKLLAETLWYWALRKTQLGQIILEPGEFNEFEGHFKYVYQMPTDRIRSVGLDSHEPFRLLRDRLYTNDTEPVLTYVFRAEVDRWPGYFRELVVDSLAGAFATSITDSSSRAQLWLSQADRARGRAMAIDAQQTPPEVFNLMRIYLRRSTNPLAAG